MKIRFVITEEITQNLKAKGGRRTPPPISQPSNIPPQIQNPDYAQSLSKLSVDDIAKVLERYGNDISRLKQAVMKIIQRIS